MSDAQVAVVGGGPIGLMTALGLARGDVEVLVVDTPTSTSMSWSGVLHNAVLPHLDSLGVLGDVIDAGFVDPVWSLSVLATGEQIVFDLSELRDRLPHPYYAYVETAPLVEVLSAHLAAQPRVTRRVVTRVSGVRQDATGVDLTFDGDARVRAEWVVAADGTNSAVRRAVGVGFPGTTWPERSVLAQVEYDFSRLGYTSTTFQVDDAHGAVVQRIRDGVWRYTGVELLSLPEAGIKDRLDETLATVCGTDVRVTDWSWDRMHQRTASQFRAGRVLLAGEAAHVTNRLTGHRSVSSFLDSRDVVEALVAHVRDGAGQSVLDDYAEGRRREFLDNASPASKSRMRMVTDLTDEASYDAEIASLRAARSDADALEELVMFGVGRPGPGESF